MNLPKIANIYNIRSLYLPRIVIFASVMVIVIPAREGQLKRESVKRIVANTKYMLICHQGKAKEKRVIRFMLAQLNH